MKITCDYGEFDVFTYREPGVKSINRAVSVDSLVRALGLSFRRLPAGPDVRYVELGEKILVPIHHLNTWLTVVKADPEVINRLSLHLSDHVSRDVGFLSYAHIQLQESLTALGAYYIESRLDAEYPVDEVEDSLYEFFCDFLQSGEYDPLLLKVGDRPMTDVEIWGLSILETTASQHIRQFISDRLDPRDILLYLQVRLKESVWRIGDQVRSMAAEFAAPE